MRLTSIRIIFLLFFGSILIRLFYWQVVKADELTSIAEQQHFKNIKLGAKRGQILFSDGFILASTKLIFTLFGQPKLISSDDKTKASSQLSKLISEDQELVSQFQDNQTQEITSDLIKLKIFEKLSSNLYWVPIIKNLNIEQKVKIEQLNLKGLGFEQSVGRFYPEGSSSAHLLGFVGSDSQRGFTGYFGLEGYFDGELKGISGLVRHERDASGLPILIGQFLTNQARDGNDLVLNVDRVIQFTVEQILKKGIEKYGAKSASAIVMDPKTGGILALASYPNYDPSQYFRFPKEYYKDLLVADQYEPGSTFKVLVMSAAINENLVKPDTKCDICSRPVEIGGFSIRTWDNKYRPDATMTDVIVHSDNIGMVFTGKKLGFDKFYQYLEDFGFGKTTNIDLQDETVPDIRAKNSWGEIDLATASFGQGIAVTPIQMITAISAIANGGYLMEPHVVKEIRSNNSVFEIKPKIVKKVLSESTAKTVTEMMVKAVNDGEARVFKPKGFNIAGKTGTAQIPVAGHYDPTKTIASFVGFAPAEDPKFIMLVRFDQPSSSIFGSETAAPTFFDIAKDLFNYYGIAPSE